MAQQDYMRTYQPGDATSISYPPISGGAPKPDLNAPWWSRDYAAGANMSDQTGLELEKKRRTEGARQQISDPVKSIVQTGTLPVNSPQPIGIASMPAIGNEGRSVPSKISADSPGAISVPKSITSGIGGDGSVYSPQDYSGMSMHQRGQIADAMRSAIDQKTGVSSAGDGGIAGMAKRFDAYQKNPEAMAQRNMQEDALGSGIRLEKSAGGGLSITNGGQYNPIPAAGGSSINMQEGNAVLARANDIRGQMIDQMAKREGGGGIGIVGGGAPTEAEQINAERTNRWAIQDLANAMKGAGTRTERAGAASALQSMIAGKNQSAQEQLRQQGITAGVNAQLRGQDLSAANQSAQRELEAQRIAMDAPRIAAQTAGIDQQNKTASMLSGLQERAINGDKAAAETLRALNGKGGEDTNRFMPVTKKVYNEMGQVVGEDIGGFDKRTGQSVGGAQANQQGGEAERIRASAMSGKISREEAIKQLQALGYK